MKANVKARDEAVADVLGNILMVGITVSMMVGLSILVLSFGGPPDKVHAELKVDLSPGGLAWGDGNEEVRVRHVGGEALPTSETRIIVTVNQSATAYTGAALDQGFGDGAFTIGDTWAMTLTVPAGAAVEVSVIQTEANQVISTNYLSADVSLASSANTTITYVATGSAFQGALTNFPNAQSASDAGAFATVAEASIPGGSATSQQSGLVNNAVGVVGPDLVKASDDARAIYKEAGNLVAVDQFGLPAGLTAITGVKIGFEGAKGGGGGTNGDPQMRISYSGVPLALGSSKTVTLSSGTEASYLLDITGDKPVWAASDLQAIIVKVDRITSDAEARDADVDHIFLEITYNEAPTTDANVQFDFLSVPAGSIHEVQVRYSRSGDTFALEVHNGAAWVQRGTLTSETMSLFTYTLTNPEFKAGSPQIRFVDLDTGATAGTLKIDYARIQTQ